MTDVDKAAFQEICSLPRFRDAITLIAATKLNWWQTNHHVGWAGDEGALRICPETMALDFLTQNLQGNYANHTMHIIGRWCCTINMLGSGFARIPGV